MPTSFTSLATVSTYREQRRHLYPSKCSLHWQIRQHRNVFIAAGALLMINDRWFADPERFGACELAIDMRADKRHSGAAE